MDFGDKTQDVCKSATRLVARMKRDWLHTGRRPSGICGAALLVAARLHGYTCTLSDVVKVVKIGHDTIRKRLEPFKISNIAWVDVYRTIIDTKYINLSLTHEQVSTVHMHIVTRLETREYKIFHH